MVCSVSSATPRAAGPRLGWGASGLGVLSPPPLQAPEAGQVSDLEADSVVEDKPHEHLGSYTKSHS